MKFDIIKKINIKNKSFRVNSVCSNHDVDVDNFCQRFTGNIDIEDKEWNIGVIVGRSGSGKSTIAREVFGRETISNFKYNSNSVIDDFDKNISTEKIFKVLNRVGFGSPPSWLKRYEVLSNGEKMRVDLARAILSDNEIILFDEFTSVVDRNIAKFGSFATQKAIRKENKKFVAVSCHRDIIEWLEPDWVYDTDKKEFFFIKNQKDPKDLKSMLLLKNQIDQNGDIIENFII